MTNSLTPAAVRVRQARTALILDQPFFGVLALQLRIEEDPTCDTAWTNGRSLGYNPAFVATLTDAALQGLICHEVMHCACGHPWRRGARDPKRFNVAADYAINPIIRTAGMDLPVDALIDPQFSGKYAEWIYDRLPEPQPAPDKTPNDQGDQGDQGDSGSPSNDAPEDDASQPGEVRDSPTDADAPSEGDWAESVAQAQKVAQAHGRLPAGMARDLGQAKAPTVDWRSALRRFVQETCSSDYTWTRPNTRYVPSGLYLPSLRAIQCGRIVIAVDTSGSIDAVLLAQFGAEIQAIAEDLQPRAIDVLYCDAAIRRIDTFERGDPITLTASGGGGTAFDPVFEHMAEANDPPAVLVYLTDLCGPMPTTIPDYPVLWAVVGDYTPDDLPFGDVLSVN